MGYLKDLHGLTLHGEVPDGTCKMCGTKHLPDQPHNRDSLVYQYQFYDKCGRWPTWRDAMSHCRDGIQKAWIEVLEKRGIKVE